MLQVGLVALGIAAGVVLELILGARVKSAVLKEVAKLEALVEVSNSVVRSDVKASLARIKSLL